MQRALNYNDKNREATILSAIYEKQLIENGQKLVEKIPYKYKYYYEWQVNFKS